MIALKVKIMSAIVLHLFAFTCSFSQVKHIVVIGIDGIGTYGIKGAEIPVMDSIIQYGAFTFEAQAINPTLSSPNWATLLMGVKPAVHKIRNNRKVRYNYTNDGTYPTLFKLLNDQDSLKTSTVVHEWPEFEKLIEPGVVNKIVCAQGTDSIVMLSDSYLTSNSPYFTFIHLDLVDHAGHTYGMLSPEYRTAVEKADFYIEEIIHSVNASSMKDSTVVIITSDHGFKGRSHGGKSRTERLVPWMAIGAGIKERYKIQHAVGPHDTAKTLAYLMDLKTPKNWKGKVLSEILK